MFCPIAADWGNVADWVSGLGSMGAVIVALGIARRDGNLRRADDGARDLRAAEDENAMIVQALELHRELNSNIREAIDAFEGSGAPLSWFELQDKARATGETALRLQRLPAVNIRMYAEFEKINQLARSVVFISFKNDKSDNILHILKRAYTTSRNTYEALMSTPNPQSILKW